MQKIFALAVILFLAACNNSSSSTETKETSAATTPAENIEYAYMPADHQPDYWEMGDQKNVAMVLKSLKAFETGDVENALAAFADTVHWSFSGFDQKLSKDSLKAMFTDFWKNTASMKIVMGDYESVISKDKKQEWVTLWYKQIVTGKNGQTDSVALVNDLKIENGKIALLDEKERKFPAPKK